MPTVVKTVTDATFGAEVLGRDLPVLVDFWADWCGPCRRMAPMFDDLATEFEGELVVVKLDIDANRETATTHGVMSLPTLKLFLDGAVVHTVVGAVSKVELLAELANWLPPRTARGD